MTEEYTCDICDKEMKDYDPMICCSAYDCGCMGKPTNPPICSNECWDKMTNGETHESQSTLQPLDTKTNI